MVSITTSVTKPPGGPGVAQEARGLLHALFDNDTRARNGSLRDMYPRK
jgi:hypothetical protein